MPIALILAAGLGERLGATRPKALVELAGRPLLQWSLDVLRQVQAIEQIVVALPANTEPPAGTLGVLGGTVRSESVKLALAAAGAGDPVLIHDAARPLLSSELVRETLAAVERDGVDGAIAAAAVTDTVKRASSSLQPQDGDAPTRSDLRSPDSYAATRSSPRSLDSYAATRSLPIVDETLDRAALWAVQTPQVFRRASLEEALNVPDEVLAQATDDAWLVERAGGRVVIVSAPSSNIKITTAFDLELAELLFARRADTA